MRGLELPERTEDFTADPVELFFDLAYVFAFSQIVSLLLANPTWDGIGDALLIFLLLWLPWSQFAWSANAVPGNSRTVRILFLVATAASVPMAAAVSTALTSGGGFYAVPLAVIFLSALGMMVAGLDRDSEEFRSAIRYARPNLVAMTIIVIGGFVESPLRVVLWIVAICIFGYSTVRAGDGTWIIRSGHFAERHGLIVIVALGEVIFALGNATIRSITDDVEDVTLVGAVALVAAGGLAGLLWWSYFDRVGPALEHRSEETPDATRGRLARDIYTYAHAPIVAGIILIAVALEEMALHPDESTDATFRFMGSAGVALFFGGIALAVHRAFRAIAKERLVAIVMITLLLGFGSDINGVWLIVLMASTLFLTLLAEHIRIEGGAAGSGSVDDGRVDGEAAH